MALLRSFFQRRVRVYVLIRRSSSVRGVLSAYLSTFDKHWNLLLMDVEESFSMWEWRKCGKHTIQELTQQKLHFQLPKQRKAAAATDAKQGTSSAADTSEESAASTAATAASPASAAGVDPVDTSAPPPSPPLYVRVEVWKQRHLQQLYVRGDGIVSVSEHAPQGLQQLHTFLG